MIMIRKQTIGHHRHIAFLRHTPDYGREYLDYVGMRPITPTGVWGKPTAADPEQAKQSITQWVARSVDYIQATFAELAKLKKLQT